MSGSYSLLPPPGPIALRAVQEAEANIGVTEDHGSNWGTAVRKYLAAVGIRVPNPWCMAFVVFRLLDAAADLGRVVPQSMPRTGYTPTFARWAQDHGLWIPVAVARAQPRLVKRGDLTFYYFRRMGRIAHVGMVTGILANGAGFRDVEGNTSRPGAGVDRDGGGVYGKPRTWDQLGARGGFVRLPW